MDERCTCVLRVVIDLLLIVTVGWLRVAAWTRWGRLVALGWTGSTGQVAD